jgi:putative mRNA 3-end processing factor
VFVRDTVDAYIADILRGDEPWDDVEQEEEADSLSLDTGPVLGALLSSAATDYDSVEVFALEYLRDAAGVDEADGTIPVRDNKSIAGLLDAVVENEDSPSESSGDIVEDALRREFS